MIYNYWRVVRLLFWIYLNNRFLSQKPQTLKADLRCSTRYTICVPLISIRWIFQSHHSNKSLDQRALRPKYFMTLINSWLSSRDKKNCQKWKRRPVVNIFSSWKVRFAFFFLRTTLNASHKLFNDINFLILFFWRGWHSAKPFFFCSI